MNFKNALIVFSVVAAGLIFSAIALANSSMAAPADDKENKPSKTFVENRKFYDYKDGVFMVRAGAGGPIAPLTMFFPQHAEIKVGESVMWYNPTRVGEPHTVTFITDPGYFAAPESPYLVSNTTEFTPLAEGNSDPVVMPGPNGTNIVVVANARSYSPVVVDAGGNATYLQPNSTYHFDGTEKYVNSGWIWPEGQAPQGMPEIETFTVMFDKEGEYYYLCMVHPWMTGTVVVK